MKKLILPQKKYTALLSPRENQKAIKFIKDTLQKELSRNLNLERMSAPLFVSKTSGINDDLNGVERKVHFTAKSTDGTYEVVQSLAKWKRLALYRFGYEEGCGIYTDMNAIRRDDDLDNTHSIFVDQWDWEKVITRSDRTTQYLKDTVIKIVDAIVTTHEKAKEKFPQITNTLSRDVHFITSQELEDLYPDMTGKEREDAITKKYGTVFLMEIGAALKSGKPHDGRAPDYDDWSLNGDLLFWNDILGASLEVSSMGIRVDEKSLRSQLEIADKLDRLKFDYHKKILDGTLPLTIGGGIGQSRICLLLLEKAHIGEVQVSAWPDSMRKKCEENSIPLL